MEMVQTVFAIKIVTDVRHDKQTRQSGIHTTLRIGVGINSSDGRVLRVFASGTVKLGLISSRVKSMTLKLVLTASLLDVQH